MTDRLNWITEILPECETFADIGCDHGYVTEAMIKRGKCKKAIFSDVSERCLKKAETLLSSFVKSGVAVPIQSDGFENIEACDLALIAGMGGEEIIKILKSATNLPKNLCVQPMRNTDRVRKTLLETGYAIRYDETRKFSDKFYDLILAEKGEDVLTEEEIFFGRTNVLKLNPDFREKCMKDYKEIQALLSGNLSEERVKELNIRAEKLKKYAFGTKTV